MQGLTQQASPSRAIPRLRTFLSHSHLHTAPAPLLFTHVPCLDMDPRSTTRLAQADIQQVSSLVERFQNAAKHQQQAIKREQDREAQLSSRRSSSSSYGVGAGAGGNGVVEPQVTGGGAAPNWRAGLRKVSGGAGPDTGAGKGKGASAVIEGEREPGSSASGENGANAHVGSKGGDEVDQEEVLRDEASPGEQREPSDGLGANREKIGEKANEGQAGRVLEPATPATPSGKANVNPSPGSGKATATPARSGSPTSPKSRKTQSQSITKSTSPSTSKRSSSAVTTTPTPASASAATQPHGPKSPESSSTTRLAPPSIRTALTPSHTGTSASSAKSPLPSGSKSPFSPNPLKPQITSTPTRPTASSLAKARTSLGPMASASPSANARRASLSGSGGGTASPLIQQKTGNGGVRAGMTSPPSAYTPTSARASKEAGNGQGTGRVNGTMTIGRKAGVRASMPPTPSAVPLPATPNGASGRASAIGRKASLSRPPIPAGQAASVSTPSASKVRPRTSLGTSTPSTLAHAPKATTPVTAPGSRLLQGTASSRAKAAAAAAVATPSPAKETGKGGAKAAERGGSPLKAKVKIRAYKPPAAVQPAAEGEQGARVGDVSEPQTVNSSGNGPESAHAEGKPSSSGRAEERGPTSASADPTTSEAARDDQQTFASKTSAAEPHDAPAPAQDDPDSKQGDQANAASEEVPATIIGRLGLPAVHVPHVLPPQDDGQDKDGEAEKKDEPIAQGENAEQKDQEDGQDKETIASGAVPEVVDVPDDQ